VSARAGRNFLLTVLCLATEREEDDIVREQRGAPTSSVESAASTATVLSSETRKLAWSRINGIYHMTADVETTWYDFACRILALATDSPDADWFRAATANGPLVVRRAVPTTTSDFLTPARRPAYSVLADRLK
jgi:dTDP-4-dehydrorhamnose reductase